MLGLSLPQTIAVSILPLLFAIVIHEVAHGWAAYKLGDPTAKMLGRLTLNPIKHIDPIGTILVPGMLLLLGGFIFGWAKPVPVTWQNLKKPRRDMALVAFAGPAANFLMAIFWGLMVKLGMMLGNDMSWLGTPLTLMGIVGITFNLILMVLNLLPILPLDGGRIVESLLPRTLSSKFSRLEPYGFFILLALIISGYLSVILGGPIQLFEQLIFTLLNL